MAASSSSSSSAVKIPPDWQHEPRFTKRSELLDARKVEPNTVARDAERRSKPHHHAGADRSFARTESIFRDSYRKSGAFDLSGLASPTSSTTTSPVDSPTSSGVATRSALQSTRQLQQRTEALAFEPRDIARHRGLPTTSDLSGWWREPRDGYVTAPTASSSPSSLRLAIGPVDPAKVRCAASIDDRRLRQARKVEIAANVSHIAHATPDVYNSNTRDAATIQRASDLYAQEPQQQQPLRCHSAAAAAAVGERSSGMSSSNSNETLCRSGSSLALVSPIRMAPTTLLASDKRRFKRPTNVQIEHFVLESEAQRVQLEHLKRCESPLASRSNSNSNDDLLDAALTAHRTTMRGLVSPVQTPTTTASSSVRCSGFVGV